MNKALSLILLLTALNTTHSLWITTQDLATVTGAPLAEAQEANDWFRKEFEIEIYGFRQYYHVIPNLINQYGYKTGIEVGVAFGGHSESILQHSGLERLWSIDPYIPNSQMGPYPSSLYYETYYQNVRVRLSRWGNRSQLVRNFVENVSDQIPNEMIDFIFIDGDHSYEGVKKDIELCWPKVRSGGMLCGDDYATSWDGVPKAVNEFFNRLGLEIHTDAEQPRIWYVFKP